MRRSIHLVMTILLVGPIWSAVAAPVLAQESARGYDPLAAGADAHRYHEARRLRDINLQLGVINQMKWYSALPAIDRALGTTAWYGNSAGGVFRDPPSLDYVYATGRRSAYGYGAWGRGLTPLYGIGYNRDIFSPWPYVPGDIYGYQWYDPVPQSIGQRQTQTGPNRWESHPVYASAAGSPPALEPPPARGGAPRPGPREF